MKLSKFKTLTKYFSVFIIALSITACEKDPVKNPQPVNEEELITTIKLTFTDSADVNNVVTAMFKDADGEGGNAPGQHDTIRLAANKTYFTSIEILDESKNPAEDITEEVKEERDEHMFFYHPENINIDVFYNDKDSKNLPVGLSTTWKTKGTGNGKIKVILKHQPDVKNGTEAPGETDVEISFVTEIH